MRRAVAVGGLVGTLVLAVACGGQVPTAAQPDVQATVNAAVQATTGRRR